MPIPSFIGAQPVTAEVTSLTSYAPVGDLGLLPVNAFVVRSRAPVLVDTGLGALSADFLAALESVIDPAELAFVWLSHMDLDHIGNIDAVAARAPNATFVTNGLGAAKLGLRGFDFSRLRVLAPGESLDAGDRRLVPVQPAYYDAPEATGFFDPRSRVLFTVDAFGALMSEPHEEARAIPSDQLFEGMARWSAIDAPWLGLIDRAKFGRALTAIERLDPSVIISAHLPTARGMTRMLIGNIERALDSGAYAEPDYAQAHRSAFEAVAA